MTLLGQLVEGTQSDTGERAEGILEYKQVCDIWMEIVKTDTYKLRFPC
ncbi:MAG: hypothetical protein P4M11_06900 [Candidatus Pacebacteria bacterium]|nr:hypothetical protein [Candidatus Paceibacterota bacterium]